MCTIALCNTGLFLQGDLLHKVRAGPCGPLLGATAGGVARPRNPGRRNLYARSASPRRRHEDLPDGATLITPLSHERFRITDVQEHRIVIDLHSGESRPLHREQFETLYNRITAAPDGFDLDRLPPDADPYPTVLSLHPRFEVDERAGTITEADPDSYTTTQLVDEDDAPSSSTPTHDHERGEPDLDVYTDALLLIDMLERHDIAALEEVERSDLVNLYTLLSDVQRDANAFRQEVSDVLLERLHHDRPVSG